ncbi:MAG TPA: hypothetical protein VEU97_13300 [Ktedonobacteraceae bacterium]|nr:hypothetical protein [Ktedonobacteraceae bacterium]
MDEFLERYQRGECEQVWEELVQFQTEIRNKPLYFDALAVAQETMRRVRNNIEILILRLQELGYQFGYEWMKPFDPFGDKWVRMQPAVYTPPSSDIVSLVEAFEQQAGPLPLSLRAFYLEVGSVNFVGTHPHWEKLLEEYNPYHLVPTTADPLFVSGFDENTLADYEDWKLECEEDALQEPYSIEIAPDFNLKYNISGAGAYEMTVPNRAIDGLLLNEWHQTTFVNYLRICFRSAGLPGLGRIRSEISNELEYATRNLLPF